MRSYRNISYYDPRGMQLEYIDSSDVHRLLAEGDHEWFCVSCKRVKTADVSIGQCPEASNHLMALRQVAVEELDDAKLKGRNESDCSLTYRDMRRNVGITEGFPGAPAETGQVSNARRRIKWWSWASAHDARAVTVVAAQ